MYKGITVGAITTIGNKHVNRGTPCEDASYAVTRNGVSVVCIADGAGGKQYTDARFGSDCAVHVITDTLCDHFDALYAENREAAVRGYLVAKLRVAFAGIMEERTIDVIDRLSCTLLFVAVKERFSEKRTVANADPSGILSRIAAEFSGERRPFFEPFLDALIGEMLISLVRPEPAPSANASADEKMAEIINYIDCNYLSICSPEELSRFGYSYHYVCARFKEIYGCAPGAYLLSKRMDHAARLLSAGQSVSAVSAVLGYSSPYNFSRAYKKHFGYPPSRKEKDHD